MQQQYKPRRFDQSPLFRVVYHYFAKFQESYYREYSEKHGQLRPIITHTVNRYLLCGDPREAFKPKFKPCRYWNTEVMAEIFRLELISLLVKKKALLPDIADNLLSWKNSGFHVYASWPFHPDEEDTLKNRLAYSFKPAVALNRLSFNGEMVFYRSKKNLSLTFTPVDFLAKLTLHIPDRYQNIRRYAGFYVSNIQRKIRTARKRTENGVSIQETKPIKPKWAALIARIFGKLPTECPKCGSVMELKQFILEVEVIQKLVPELSRAPPKLQFEHYTPSESESVYVHNEEFADFQFNQDRAFEYNQDQPLNDDFLNQDLGW